MADLKIRRIFAYFCLMCLNTVTTFPAHAGVCEETHPNWNGVPATMLQETIALFASPAALVLLIATAFVIRFRNQRGAFALVLLWTILVTLTTVVDLTGTRELAQSEGCIGSPTLFIAAVAAICVGIIIYTAPRASQN